MRGEPLAGFSLAMGEEGEASALPLEGERIKVGQEKWLKVFPKKFEVLEFVVNLKLSGEEGEDGVLCAMVVTDISLMKDGGMLVYGRAIGSTDEEFLKTLHLEMNRRKRAIHLCREKVCTAALDEVVAHSGEVALWKAQNFKGDYLKPWGSQVLKEILEKELGIGSGLSGPEPKRRSGRALKRPAASTEKPEPAPKRVRRRRDTSGKGIGGQGPGEAHGSSLLAQQLAGLKRSLLSKVKETVINVEDNEEDTPAGGGDGDMDLGFVGGERPWDSMVKQERRSSSGDHLNPKRSMLALTSGLPVEASRGGFTRRSRRRSPERTEVSKHPAQQLLAVAAEQGRSRRDQRRQRKRRGSEDGRKEKDGEDRSSRKRRRKDKKKKKEKKMKKEKGRKKRKPGGDSGGSSSSDSGSSRESDSGSSTSSSLFGSASEEEQRGAGSCSSNVGETCQGDTGSISAGGHRREQRYHQGSEAELILFPDAEAVLLNSKPGYERALPSGELCGPTSLRTVRASWRQPGIEVFGDPLRHGGGHLEECPIPRVEPARCPEQRSNTGPLGSQKACEADLQKSEPRWSAKMERVGMERRGEPQRGERKARKRPWRLGQLAKRLLVGCKPGQKGWQRWERHWRRRKGKEVSEKGEEEAEDGRIEGSTGFKDLEELVTAGCSLRKLGVGLAWFLIQAEDVDFARLAGFPVLALLRGVKVRGAGLGAMHRSKDAFPLRLGQTGLLVDAVKGSSFTDCQVDDFVSRWCGLAWLYSSIRFLNHLWGCPAAIPGRWRAHEKVAVVSLQGAIERTLAQDAGLVRTPAEVEKELSERYLNYSGDEVPKMEVLSLRQSVAALPAADRGGSIDILKWVDGRTKTFLEHPENCVLDVSEFKGNKLQAKVHIVPEDRVTLACELVLRNVCDWVDEAEVFTFNGERVLNGMFGVRKDSCLADGSPVLRTIMNLIPSNSIMCQLRGMVAELPGMSQYCSVVMEEGESLALHQSDMTSAFYLFRLPQKWQRFLCFNLKVSGEEIGRNPDRTYYLAASVLPMGWGSAVAVMQEVSSKLLLNYGLDPTSQVTRLRPLPPWLVHEIEESQKQKQGWWHVYLDNFFAGEKITNGKVGSQAKQLHVDAEAAWAEGGVVSSSKKRVSGLASVQELGAVMDGDSQYLGMSGQRLVKLCQTTLFLISQKFLNRKWLQVVCGRWVHVLQYRRQGMATLDDVWKVIANKKVGATGMIRARFELLQCIMGVCLFHTYLGAGVSPATTASDASNKGGAVGCSSGLTPVGRSFCRSLQDGSTQLTRSRVIVLSLFNGIGGAFRTYDILAIEVEALIGFDTCKASNRVCSRRWPQATLYEDVRDLDEAFLRRLLFKYPHATAIHLWAGFPCVDLSSVKAGRANLQGPESSLFFEILRIKELIVVVFGVDFTLLYFVENVASMDRAAAAEISSYLVLALQSAMLSGSADFKTEILLDEREGP